MDNAFWGRLVEQVKSSSIALKKKDAEFLQRVFSGDLSRYDQRLKQWGLTGAEHVLDAGAGFGQWSFALCQANNLVTALEYDPNRVLLLQSLCDACQVDNLSVKQGSVADLPFEDNSFDLVFCYGVVEQTPWRMVLAEFARVLRAGGKLYLNANDVGWYRFLWDSNHNITEGYNPRWFAAQAFVNTVAYEEGESVEFPAPLMISPKQLSDELTRLGFTIEGAGGEGSVTAKGYNEKIPKPFFKGEYRGDTCVHEVVAWWGNRNATENNTK